MKYRILITGSRDWTDRRTIFEALDAIGRQNTLKEKVLVSGNCPTGADLMCEEFATIAGWEIERYPADWKKHGRKAGFERNKQMVNTAPDVCLAFIKNNSKGATMTKKMAIKAGIPTHVWEK